MDYENTKILSLLEKQRDELYQTLQKTTISGLYKKEYLEQKAGRFFVIDSDERGMLRELKKLSRDTSKDIAFTKKLAEYKSLDNEKLVEYFIGELRRVLQEIKNLSKSQLLQAIFIEYDHYYHYSSSLIGLGIQDYPLIETPRYLTGEIDELNPIFFLAEGINFEPAWIDCSEFDLNYLDVEFKLEKLFRLHSRTLLHKAINQFDISAEVDVLPIRPFSFYIREHDCESMILYRMN